MTKKPKYDIIYMSEGEKTTLNKTIFYVPRSRKAIKMTDYMVIAVVNEKEYLTRVKATSELSAEHKVLGLGICSKHTYGVTACMAYNSDMMRCDEFRYRALNAEPISFEALKEIIKARNAEIAEQDAAEERIVAITSQINELHRQLEETKAIFNGKLVLD